MKEIEGLDPTRHHRIKELVGQRFGRLQVVRYLGRKDRRAYWSVVCDCGGEAIASGKGLSSGSARSCGCLAKEAATASIKANVAHRWPAGRTPVQRKPKQVHKLTHEALRALVHYDPESGVFTWLDASSSGRVLGERAGGVARFGYRKIALMGRQYFEHRVAWFYVHGEWPEDVIDHINGVPDDNRLANLRAANAEINAQNRRRARSDSQVGLMGVLALGVGKWVARISAGGKTKHLGTFRDPAAAHAAYLQAKRRVHPGFVEIEK